MTDLPQDLMARLIAELSELRAVSEALEERLCELQRQMVHLERAATERDPLQPRAEAPAL